MLVFRTLEWEFSSIPHKDGGEHEGVAWLTRDDEASPFGSPETTEPHNPKQLMLQTKGRADGGGQNPHLRAALQAGHEVAASTRMWFKAFQKPGHVHALAIGCRAGQLKRQTPCFGRQGGFRAPGASA